MPRLAMRQGVEDAFATRRSTSRQCWRTAATHPIVDNSASSLKESQSCGEAFKPTRAGRCKPREFGKGRPRSKSKKVVLHAPAAPGSVAPGTLRRWALRPAHLAPGHEEPGPWSRGTWPLVTRNLAPGHGEPEPWPRGT
jgi:hypothetical protein